MFWVVPPGALRRCTLARVAAHESLALGVAHGNRRVIRRGHGCELSAAVHLEGFDVLLS